MVKRCGGTGGSSSSNTLSVIGASMAARPGTADSLLFSSETGEGDNYYCRVSAASSSVSCLCVRFWSILLFFQTIVVCVFTE